ncbi:MAG TPA: hypothetical protein PKA20_01010 [Burkholderiaceae bacterium]|nr:hypothetical protein [Burkholderiaceae bacterium]
MQQDEFKVLDAAEFPVVRIRMQGLAPGYAEDWAREMDALLATGEPFVIMLMDEHRKDEHADARVKTMWIKANRQAFAEQCRGLVMVEPNPVKRLALKAQGAVAAKAFGMRFAIAPSAPEAETMASHLLAGQAVADADRPT